MLDSSPIPAANEQHPEGHQAHHLEATASDSPAYYRARCRLRETLTGYCDVGAALLKPGSALIVRLRRNWVDSTW